ncbi:hypothetical protein X943_001018 [Babesia divergens]|uniref:RRM domain-containing protein n=1 Tax=Babesia divergens TaxID=32595 RepID=A0AAD9LJ60_BABDI|nr:hypothetical protein X943_001018 [Babesia divergens]
MWADTIDVVNPKAITEDSDTLNVDSTTEAVASIATDEVNLSNGATGLVDEGALPDNDGGVKDTHEASDVEIANADDGNTVPTSTPGTSVSSIQRPSISEEDITRLQEIVDLVIEIGNNVSQAQDGDDEEEGAIEEDDVPFERVPDVDLNSNIVHMLNMPPEMDMDALVSKVGAMSGVVHHCYCFRPTEVKIIFVSVSMANEAKRMLDSIKIHNRTIQAVLSTPDELKPHQQPLPLPPGIGNTVMPPAFMMQHSSNRRGALPMLRAQPGYPIPPSYAPGVSVQSSPRKMSHHSSVPPAPLPPPSRHEEGQEHHGIHPSGTTTIGHSYETHMRTIFGKNIDKREGKSLFELLESIPSICNWSPDQTLEEQQRHYDMLNAEFGVTNRYMILGGLPDSATENIDAASAWLETYTRKRADIEISPNEQYFTDTGFTGSRLLHLTFQRRSDCTEVYQMFTTRHPDVLCKYAAPRKAYGTLWVGNLSDVLSYCKDQYDFKDLCARLGELKIFRFLQDKGCCFITYATVEDAINVRNRLLGASFTHGRPMGLNVDFTIDMAPRFQNRPRQDFGDSKPRDRDDISQKLGERLLSALQRRSDGDMVIRQLLEGRDSDAVNIISKSNHKTYPPQRSYEGRHGDYSRGSHASSHERSAWSKTRKRPHSSDLSPEPYKQRKQRNTPYGTALDQSASSKRMHESGHSTRRSSTPPPPMEEERVSEQQSESGAHKSKPQRMLICDLLKRGKPICKVSAIFMRGDSSHRLPQRLDVNQRANPERLANYLQKVPELSLWQLGADSAEDSVKYDGLCDYLISKNRVALVQDGPYEIYIVPPSDKYSLVSNLPDTQFMYAYVLPKGS